ncbi:hypothetical protein A2763_01690 [Candidatus Kaiserbacteria bacterium RIFCSPHIGHO2_01_FULL_54_36]|uniref:Glycosyltransferase 2-like domain-containing protein n=1 Tax=Candidatus Kaiserbacteria bacterium RIFCSPHIGHO2_01_FULL_54_36 TaxID=1798482 RepID=A0A1F6CN25_9BACT|nr:MAG: hypothetical protein A2763_01690 [Candidatus Kaiserbacteria bacterium RIFCSPHIGHO2_01_FULL_54_36]OGG75832.1 MAG: hypothetical protein A3A41_02725 [Candidatus Kaiserbacteria bacterium RIFCSPLOWO2_01_FULL_54_22]
MPGRTRVSLILPAIDETASLLETVRLSAASLPHKTLEYVIVSHPKYTTPECRAAIKTLQERYGTSVVHFDQTLPGIGGALREAILHASGDIAVIMASDLETDPTALPALLQKLEEGYDIAAATRWAKGAGFRGYHPIKFVLNFIFQRLFRILYWTDLTDLTYAYRAYRTDLLKKIRWEETDFSFLFEAILKPLRIGVKVTEVETPWKARTEGVSHNSWKQTFDYARVGVRVRFLPKSRILY